MELEIWIKVKFELFFSEAVISDSDMPVSPLNLNLTYQVLRDLTSKAEGLCWWLRAERKE